MLGLTLYRRNVLYHIQNKISFTGFLFGYKQVSLESTSNPILLWNYKFLLNDSEVKSIFKIFLSKLIWISYRSNIMPIMKIDPEMTFPQKSISYSSDAGWGCAIRSANIERGKWL